MVCYGNGSKMLTHLSNVITLNVEHSTTPRCVHKPNLGFLCQILEDFARDTIVLDLKNLFVMTVIRQCLNSY